MGGGEGTGSAPDGARIIEVWAPWCAPCRAMAPNLDELALEYEGRVTLEKVNADADPARVNELGVRVVPTVIAMTGGRETGRRMGTLSRNDLAAMFEAARAGMAPPPAGVAPADRVLRLAAATALLGMAIAFHQAILGAAGAIVAFAAVHDRCPLWNQAVKPLLRRLRGSPPPPPEPPTPG